MKVIIAGSRHINDRDLVFSVIAEMLRSSQITATEIVSGGASGVDQLGEEWAKQNNIPVKVFLAAWKDWAGLPKEKVLLREGVQGQYNALAGFNRNSEMAKYGESLLAIWDGKSHGTRHMIERMRMVGKPVTVFTVEGQQ